MGRMKDHEREFLVSCDLDPDIDNDERARALDAYRGSGPWQRAEAGLALDRFYAAVAESFEPLKAKLAHLGRLVLRRT